MERFMREALNEAKAAYALGEVPIGAVIVRGGEIIASAHNMRNTMRNALYHAEITAIHKACGIVGDWRLEGCVMYVTIEPCPMCAGAILTARMDRVVFGAENRKAGCAGSVLDILSESKFNHQVEIVKGVLEEECGGLISGFFRGMREGLVMSSRT